MIKTKYDKVKETSIEDKIWLKHKESYKYALDQTLKELAQGVESLFHNLNSLQSRSGNQLPFSSINYGTCTLKEGQYIIDALLEGQMKGTGPDHRTSIFPCAIFQYDRKINGSKNSPNYKLYRKALKSCAMRIYPNFANCGWTLQSKGQKFDREEKQNALDILYKTEPDSYNKLTVWLENHKYESYMMSLHATDGLIFTDDWDDQKPHEIMSTMGCRTYNSYDINSDSDFWVKQFKYIAEHGELPRWKMWSANQKDGRGNICPVTIILPTIAMEAKQWAEKYNKNLEERQNYFMKQLDIKIDQARQMLIERFTLICSQPEAAAKFMWNNNTMYGYDGESVSSALKHGTLAIGQIGLAETLRLLTEGKDQTTDEGMMLAKKIEGLFQQRCAEFKKNEHLNFGVYYTPAENLCKKSLQAFRERFGVIKGVSDQEFFTNSMHVPVYDKVDAFEKINIESQLTGYSSAGCITYVELDSEVENNIDAMEEIVNYAMDNDIPYFALNRRLSRCKNCGHTGDFEKCPVCGCEDIEQLARVTGYLSTDVSNMNWGKQCEVGKRVKHTGCKLYQSK